MRTALDPVDQTPLRRILRTLFDTAQAAGVIREYHFWRDYVLVTIDGVEHFASTKIHCEHCSSRSLTLPVLYRWRIHGRNDDQVPRV
jgi:hypothetical protein